MSDAAKNLQIKITTPADTSGIEQTSRGLDKLSDSTTQSGKAAERAAEEGGKKLQLSHREILLLTNQLGPGIEGLGHLFANLTSPLAAAAFGLVVLKGLFDEWNKTMDETAARNATASDSFRTLLDSQNAARQAMALLNAEIARGATATESANTAAEARMRLLHAENDAAKSHAAAMGETPFQQAELDEKNHAAEIEARRKRLGTAEARQLHLASVVPALLEAQKTEEGRRAKLKKDADDAAKDTDRLKKEMIDTAEKATMSRHWSAPRALSALVAPGVVYADWKAGQERAAAVAAVAAEAYDQNQKIIKASAQAEAIPDLTADAASRAKSEMEKNRAFVEKEGPAIKSDIDVYNVKDLSAKRDALDKMDIGGGFAGKDVEQMARLEQLKAQGRALTETQKAALDHFEKITGLGAQQVALMFRVVGSATDTATQVAALHILVDQLQKQVAATSHNHGPP